MQEERPSRSKPMEDDESRIIELLESNVKCISALDEKRISEWAKLIEQYYKHETRSHIRLKAIALLSQIFSRHHTIYEDELMSKILLPNFSDADSENDSVVRKPIVHLLFDIASTCLSYKHCNAVLAIVRKILAKPFRQRNDEASGLVYIIGNVDIIDSRLIILNLNKLFKAKLHRLPIDSAANILDISVNYLNLTYKHPFQDPIPAEIPMIRRELFTLFMNLRCNKYGHLGVLTNTDQSIDDIEFSPFILCVKRPRTSSTSSDALPASPGPDSPTQASIPLTAAATIVTATSPTITHSTQPTSNQFSFHYSQRHPLAQTQHHNIFVPNASRPNCPIVSRCVSLELLFAGIIECINQETDADVLRLVLDGLPGLLANKPLVLTATDEKINQLCLTISELIRPTKLCRQNYRTEYVKNGLRCLTPLLVYRRQLEQKSIKVMLAALDDSLKNYSPLVVPLLTTCLVELKDSSEMTKFIPVILKRLSRMSQTPTLGTSMLEFLSYLILFPKLYENFSEDEYKYIFAIALPYTNPFRFTDYITCLAFRVIAMWYLNCRPSLRRAFVGFVKSSLQSNVIQPFKENPAPQYTYSQTSSPIKSTPPITYSCPPAMSTLDQRRRSSSLNTENSFNFQQAALITNPQLSLQVNKELIETFSDLLSRYTHGQYLAIAPKNRYTEVLLDRSTSQTWLHGNCLVTITSDGSNYGWAEILIRRPTGNTSWIGRLQNTVGALPMLNQQVYFDSLNFGNDIISLFSSLSPHHESTDDTSSTGLNSPPAPSTPTEHSVCDGCSRSCEPIPLPKDKKFEVALSNFDHITPYETHKVGVVYVSKNQVDDRAAILSNRCGSPRYHEFLRHVGTCIVLKDIDPEIYFIGGLDVNGEDGKYAYFWKDNVTQVIFHVATFMLQKENDPNCNNKNRHIGNDHVCIVYNDSKKPFKLSTIKGTGQLIMACVVISPLEDDTNIIEVEFLPDLGSILGYIEPKVLSNLGASLYARQLAIHLNLASKIYERRYVEGCNKDPYVSNWIERLRCIKRLRQRLDDSPKVTTGGNPLPKGSMLLR